MVNSKLTCSDALTVLLSLMMLSLSLTHFFFHFLDGLGDRMRKRQAVAEDQVWTKEFVPLFLERSLKLTNILVALEPGTSLVTDFGQRPCPSGPGIVTVGFLRFF